MKDELWLRTVLSDVENQMRENNIEGFKSIIKTLIKDIIKVLKDTQVEWELNHNSRELGERFHVLSHYLDYLRRFCEGVV